MELNGRLTTKELKKKHPSRLVGGVEMGSQAGEDIWQGGSWRWSRLCLWNSREEQLGGKTDHTTQGSSVGN